MSKQSDPERHDDERDRRVTNIFLVVMFVLVVGVGVWLANAMLDYRNLDNCISQGRRDCGSYKVEDAR